jgi:hypothetical protein
MPSWARLKPKLYGLGGGVVGGAVGGIGWHFATIYADPPRVFIVVIEVVLLTVVMVLAIPHSPQTPNLNLIPIIH